MKKQYFPIFLIFISIIMFMLLPLVAAHTIPDTVYASSSDYTITSWYKKSSEIYFNAEEGCTYTLTITENFDTPIEKIFYSAYQVSINTEDISYDDEDNILNPIVKDKDGNELNRVEITEIQGRDEDYNDQRQRQLSFEVTAHEWSAYQFYVQWDNMGESYEEIGDFLYCTNIDNSPPQISLTDQPIFQDSGYVFNFLVRANEWTNDRSANSGFKKVIVYRELDGQKETVKEYTKFNNSLTFYGDMLAIKGEYFIEAIDGVGNKKTVRVTKIDVDIETQITIANIESVLANKEEYRLDLIDNLYTLYVKWQLMNYDNDITKEQLEAAYNNALEALTQCTLAQKEFKVKVINNFYVGDIKVENFNEETYLDILNGETVTMHISLAEYNAKNLEFKEAFNESGLKKASRILALSVDLTSNLKELTLSDFENPVKITIPLSKYKNIAAVSKNIINGKSVYTKLRLDKGNDWIMVYLQNGNTTVNLVIDDGSKDKLKFLYLLFLLIPIAGGIIVFIYKDKIFKNKQDDAINTSVLEEEQKTSDAQNHPQQIKQHNQQNSKKNRTSTNKKKK